MIKELIDNVLNSNEYTIKENSKILKLKLKEFDKVFDREQKNHSHKLVKWLYKYGYENMYNDIKKDGKTWICIYEEDFSDYLSSKKYTFRELYKKFIIDSLC